MTGRHLEVDGVLGINDVPDVRRFVATVHHRFVPDDDDLSRVAMATHELLENAVKFSVDGIATLRIELLANNRISITTRNRAHPENVEDLKQLAREIHEAVHPMLHYLDLMRRSPNRSMGGLGLGRVAAEGEMQIDLQLDGEFVQVRAETTLAEPR
ncbi:MAG: hypothetical protein JWO36_2291 [Myxococcales bacterium]|nr:hypothetical protein [Myxococcales bacterium]